MDVRVLGPLEMYDGARPVPLGPRRGERLLLGLLALEAGQVVGIERLTDLLWGGAPPPAANATVQTHVARLRTRLDPARDGGSGVRLLRRGDGYQLELDSGSVDAQRFRADVESAGALPDPPARADALRVALALWRGPLLADVADDRLRDRVGLGLEELRLSALEQAVDAELRCGRHHELIPELTDLAVAHPTRWRLTAAFMLALHRAGRQADALAAYRRVRTHLAEVLGLDPHPELRDLHDALLRDGPAPAAVRAGEPRLLPIRPRHFTGRDEELARLDAVPDKDTTVIAVITGTAGVGKTALAVEWAHRAADRFPDGTLYVDLRGFGAVPAMSTPQAVRSFLDALGVAPHRVPADPVAQADLYRMLLAARKVLVVLDNAADANHVRALLPASPGSCVLVTSRDHLAGLVAIEGAEPLPLDLLSPRDAHAMLERRFGAARVAAEPEAVEAIVRRCAGLPLALAVVAARGAMDAGAPLAALATRLDDGVLTPLSRNDPATDLRAVFSCSYRRLTPPAAHLFRLLGCKPGADITLPAIANLTGTDPAATRAEVAELVEASLLGPGTAPGRYATHDLLLEYARELSATLDSPAERTAATRRVYGYYAHTAHRAARMIHPHRDSVPVGDPDPDVVPLEHADAAEAFTWFAAEYPVLCAAVTTCAQAGLPGFAAPMTWALEPYAQRSSRWADLPALLEATLATGTERAYAIRSLGRTYVWLDRFDEAEEHLRLALDLYTAAGDLVAQARTHHGLTEMYEHTRDLPAALRHGERALALYEEAGDLPGQARAGNAIGWCHCRLGDARSGVRECERALEVVRQIGDRVAEAETLDSLGYAHRLLGDVAEAIANYERAVELCRELGDRYHVAEVLTRCGEAYRTAGRPADARQALHEALTILEELGHPGADAVRSSVEELAVTSSEGG